MTNLFGNSLWPTDVIYNISCEDGGKCKGSATVEHFSSQVNPIIDFLDINGEFKIWGNATVEQYPNDDTATLQELHWSESEICEIEATPRYNQLTLTSEDYLKSNGLSSPEIPEN
jgi:hypothetical protein